MCYRYSSTWVVAVPWSLSQPQCLEQTSPEWGCLCERAMLPTSFSSRASKNHAGFTGAPKEAKKPKPGGNCCQPKATIQNFGAQSNSSTWYPFILTFGYVYARSICKTGEQHQEGGVQRGSSTRVPRESNSAPRAEMGPGGGPPLPGQPAPQEPFRGSRD